MVQLSFKPRREQAPLLAACTKTPAPVGRPPAAVGSVVPVTAVSFDDLPDPVTKAISFDDITASDEPEVLAVAGEPFKAVYPGVSADALAWMRTLDNDDQVLAAAAAPPAEEPPTVPVADQRLLFNALDALDRLPMLYGDADEGSFQLAMNAAAVQTYVALQPSLVCRHEIRMLLAPLTAELAAPLAVEPETAVAA